ncbi:phosphate:acyl-[acyl carrier protein] acyltransferase [Desulfonispora thiosulfatigenes DSM 11270]|uniref:Phosphate acyltransferase n=1 Tax=Desulfonispora thiosulfatigenes DSM 11270 TaxID=656914 RepID=A0A1W1VK55_DESTI|nr:phosphate acyltransferase PlsX [Desulfonispora thiosulfatigenes]SMB93600.1 phosphate:acyl-[acyl carrier protein] acyltransferase [Desulfonispora thiosulfatigenes DSM 11270]
MRIALDAMGGDHAPKEIVQGAIEAINKYSFIEKIFIVGHKDKINPYLENGQNKLEIIHASENITMDDIPTVSYRTKKDASISIAAKMVKDKEADALISAGSTGAQMVASLFGIGRIKAVDRPAIATVLPTLEGYKLLLDIGANTNCKVKNLKQFAMMGSIYAEKILEIKNPKIALINNGTEKTKGNELVQQTYIELENMPGINFTGNIEGRDILLGSADVMVCDGFVGNIVLKLIEGMAKAVTSLAKEEIDKSIRAKIGAGLLLPVVKELKSKLDYSEYGGAPLLGIDGISIICHGSSKAKAICNSINIAYNCHKSDLIKIMTNNLKMGDV